MDEGTGNGRLNTGGAEKMTEWKREKWRGRGRERRDHFDDRSNRKREDNQSDQAHGCLTANEQAISFWANQSLDCTIRRNGRKLECLADEIKAIKPSQMTFIVCERL